MAWEARQGGARDRSAGANARTQGTTSVPPSARQSLGKSRGSWGCPRGLLSEGASRQSLGAAVTLQPPWGCLRSSLQTAGTCLVAFITLLRGPGKVSLGCFCCTIVSLLADMKQCYLHPSCCQEAEEVLGALVGREEPAACWERNKQRV